MGHKFQLVHAIPSRTWAVLLSWFLFALGIGLYLQTAHRRHQENTDDRIVPTVPQMARSTYDAAFKPAEDDEQTITENASLPQRFFASMLWKDTKATSRRFFYSLLLLTPAVILGLHMGLFPYVGVFFSRFVLFFDKIVSLSLLPILFIAFGIDELSKIMLIAINRIGRSERATILSKKSTKREKKTPTYGNRPMWRPRMTAGVSSSKL